MPRKKVERNTALTHLAEEGARKFCPCGDLYPAERTRPADSESETLALRRAPFARKDRKTRPRVKQKMAVSGSFQIST